MKEHVIGTLYEFERLHAPLVIPKDEVPQKEDYKLEVPYMVTMDLSDVSFMEPARVGDPRVVVN